ncbi:GTP-binding protein [Rothia uropygialis]|uniref:GTP-binding protein n=1 Tax=Kocuria sp. 36 TaxID=1415402 RepID=UPI00101D4866|nr:GTP-binding protein [Kocuria sp. 36]
MDTTTVIAVIGTCEPERRLHAQYLAHETGQELIHAKRLGVAMDPVREATSVIPWTLSSEVVVEYPIQAPIQDIIGSLVDPEEPTRLGGVVCVLDATHFFGELNRSDQVEHLEMHHGTAFTAMTARALLASQHIEYCSTALIVNWQRLPPEELSLIKAVIGELSPLARVVLQGDEQWMRELARTDAKGENSLPDQQSDIHIRPGWVAHLNGQHASRHRNPRVASMRYSNPRPFHPIRLKQVLDEHIEPGESGIVVRSCGFCRLATRQGITAHWSQTGAVMSIEPLARDTDTFTEPLSFGQDIVLTGIDLQPTALTRALDEATLNDRELLSDPETWRYMPDPFPVWVTADDRRE